VRAHGERRGDGAQARQRAGKARGRLGQAAGPRARQQRAVQRLADRRIHVACSARDGLAGVMRAGQSITRCSAHPHAAALRGDDVARVQGG